MCEQQKPSSAFMDTYATSMLFASGTFFSHDTVYKKKDAGYRLKNITVKTELIIIKPPKEIAN